MKCLLLLALTLSLAYPQDAARPGQPKSKFTVTASPQDPHTWIATAESIRLVFSPPRTWSVGHNESQQSISIRNNDALITIFLQTSNPSSEPAWPAALLAAKPGSTTTDKATALLVGESVPTYDLAWSVGNSMFAGRYARARTPDAALRIQIECSKESFADHLGIYMQLLASVRVVGKSERLDITPRGSE